MECRARDEGCDCDAIQHWWLIPLCTVFSIQDRGGPDVASAPAPQLGNTKRWIHSQRTVAWIWCQAYGFWCTNTCTSKREIGNGVPPVRLFRSCCGYWSNHGRSLRNASCLCEWESRVSECSGIEAPQIHCLHIPVTGEGEVTLQAL